MAKVLTEEEIRELVSVTAEETRRRGRTTRKDRLFLRIVATIEAQAEVVEAAREYVQPDSDVNEWRRLNEALARLDTATDAGTGSGPQAPG